MDKETKEIIQHIASIQMDAIQNIIDRPEDNDYDQLLRLIGSKPEDLISTAEEIYDYYKEVEETPELICMATEYQLLVCHHILFVMEDEWLIENSQGVYGAWEVLRRELDKFHPEFKIII